MNFSDKKIFVEALTACSSIYRQSLENPVITVFWRLLEEYELNDVLMAFDKHLAESKFMPTPAEIITRIPKSKTNLDKNEAWALCQRLTTEDDTAIITNNMRDAWAIAYPILERGDKVGARMAFNEAYERLLTEYPETKWEVQGGTNKELKYQRVSEAVRLGRLSDSQLKIHCHNTESIGFDGLTKLALNQGNKGKKGKKILKGKWAAVKLNIRNSSAAEEQRYLKRKQEEREKSEAHRNEVLSRAEDAMKSKNKY